MICPTCENEMKLATLPHTIVVGEDRFEIAVKGWKCPCGETFVDGSEVERAEFAVASELVCAARITKETFRLFRVLLGWTGVETAQRLGVAAETVSRWENGARDVDRLAWTLLASAVRDREDDRHDTVDLLEVVRAPRPIRNQLTIHARARGRADLARAKKPAAKPRAKQAG